MSSKSRFVNGPALWDKILAAAPAGAVIAGGAVRDYLLGLPFKDMDVFVPKMETALQLGPSGALHDRDSDFKYVPVPDDRKEEYEGKQFVMFVTDYTLNGVSVQIIDTFIEPGDGFGQRLVDTFDFGLTRYWYDGTVHDTPEAATDRHHSTITDLIGDRPDRAQVRAERFIARNPGRFTFVPFKADQ